MSLIHDENMVLTVRQEGRYQRLRLRVPERWRGIVWNEYARVGVKQGGPKGPPATDA